MIPIPDDLRHRLWESLIVVGGGLIWAAIAYWAYAVYQVATVREVLNEELTMRLVIEGAGTTREAVAVGGGDALLGMLVMPVRYAVLGGVVLYVAVPAMAAFAGTVKQAGCAVARWVWQRSGLRDEIDLREKFEQDRKQFLESLPQWAFENYAAPEDLKEEIRRERGDAR